MGLLDAEGDVVVSEGYQDALGTGACQPRDAIVVVNDDVELVPWQPLPDQRIGAVLQEVIRGALEGDVMGVAIHITPACGKDGGDSHVHTRSQTYTHTGVSLGGVKLE